jgi:hypothetical protein
VHKPGLILQPLTVGTTSQGSGGIVGWFSAYGISIFVGAVVVVLALMVIAMCRRTRANSRGNEKKF